MHQSGLLLVVFVFHPGNFEMYPLRKQNSIATAAAPNKAKLSIPLNTPC